MSAAHEPMSTAHFILYVADQSASAKFYRDALAAEPRLDVPGMTEFSLANGAVLGLMPAAGVKRLLADIADSIATAQGQRAEVYLVVADARASHARALRAGARELSPVAARDWGDDAGYALDPDGHVLAFATPSALSNAPRDDNAALRALHDTWICALEARNLDAMMQPYAPDVIFYDVKPPMRFVGAHVLRAAWEACLPYIPLVIKAQTSDFAAQASGDLAFTHCLCRFGAPDGANQCPWFRMTRCYQRQGASWRIVHEHCSMPFDPMTSQVVLDFDARA